MNKIAVFLFLFCAASVAAQVPDEAVIATVGDDVVTAGEFRARYALTVFPYKDQERLTPVVMRQFLYALVAERLLAQEARRSGFDAEDHFRRNLRMAEEMFVRDRLFRDSVRAQVEVTADEVRQRYIDEQRAVQYDFLRFPDEERVRNLHRIYLSGVPFDTLLAAQRRVTDPGTAQQQGGVAEAFGSKIDTLCDGCVSLPLEGEDGWYLVRRRTAFTGLPDDHTFEKSYRRIAGQLRTEEETAASVDFVRRLWKGREAKIEEEFYRGIGEALLEEYDRQRRAGRDMLSAPNALFDSLRGRWTLQLDAPFARVGDDVLTVGEALDHLSGLDLRLQREQADRARVLYRERVRDMLDRFVVTRAGYAAGLHQSDEVRRDVSMWVANGLAQSVPDLLFEQFIAQDDSLWQLYADRPDIFGPPVEIRVIEIFSRDSLRMADAAAAFAEGASLERLAAQFRDEGEDPARNGVSAWFPVTERETVGRRAFAMRVADAAGPLRSGGGWSLFQLRDRRYPGMRLTGWNDLRDSTAAVAGDAILRARVDQLVRRLAGSTPITVDAALLDAIDVPAAQMHTVRILGFGGRIPAMPAVMPLYEAVMEGMMEAGKPVP